MGTAEAASAARIVETTSVARTVETTSLVADDWR
jgi:hypothetical protein